MIFGEKYPKSKMSEDAKTDISPEKKLEKFLECHKIGEKEPNGARKMASVIKEIDPHIPKEVRNAWIDGIFSIYKYLDLKGSHASPEQIYALKIDGWDMLAELLHKLAPGNETIMKIYNQT